MPRLTLLFLTFLLGIGTANAQQPNPFKSIGKKAKILTAYDGRFDEFFDYDTIQRIGSVRFNTRSKKIVCLLNADTTFLQFSDNSTVSRWYSTDPLGATTKNISYSPYSFVRNNPVILIDPDGRDWFYYQAGKEKSKSWHYQQGKTATYINSKGKEVTTSKGYSHLVTFEVTGKNREGGSVGTLTVYNQDKIVLKSNAFSGGDTYGLKPTAKGNYIMNLKVRDKDGPDKMNDAKDNPEPAWGIQRIPNRELIEGNKSYDVGGAYGGGRIRLMETDDDLNVLASQQHGYYLHGKYDNHNWTHGCICDKSEAVFNYFWSGAGKDVKGYVPVSVQ